MREAYMKNLLLEYGIKLDLLLAGLLGGVVNAFVFKPSDPWSVIGSVVVGAFTANYLGEPLGAFFGLTAGPGGFLTGLGGMALCQGLFDMVRAWRPGPHDGKP